MIRSETEPDTNGSHIGHLMSGIQDQSARNGGLKSHFSLQWPPCINNIVGHSYVSSSARKTSRKTFLMHY